MDNINQRIIEKAKRKLDSLFESYAMIAEDRYVFLCDMRYDYSRWSKALVDDFGLPSEYMYGAGEIWEEHIHPEDRGGYRLQLDNIFAGREKCHDIQYRAKSIDGEYNLCTCRGIVVTDEYGKPEYFGGTIRNHSQRSHIDTLTGLRNQYGFFADLQKYIRNHVPVRIGMAGIGKLTEINEVYGYTVGNTLLQYFGRYLMDNVTSRNDTYRMDGACFAIISKTQSEQELYDLYEEIRGHFRKGIKFNDMDMIIELNAGLITLDDFNVDDQTVYSCLNFAYEESKINKHGDLVIFKNELTENNRKRLEKLHAIRASITKNFNGFYLVYQPVVDAESEKLIGAEALLRWKSDEYGVVPPDLFIPFLENDPLFPDLGEWVLNTAIKDAGRIMEYIPDFIMNVNLSYSQLERADFTDVVWNMIKKSEFSPNQLCLELTERCRLLDMDMLRNVMVSLRQGGIRIALDDFGTGFSSVGLVKNLPFDTIKVDRSFVQQIENDDREKKLLNNFTDIAGTFGAEVCVEGIETTGMRDIIKDYGIHSFQGYYYSKPISIDELLEKVKSGDHCFSK